MAITKTSFIPRAFHKWELNLGLKNRAKLQGLQYKQHLLRAANAIVRSPRLNKSIVRTGNRIVDIFDRGYLKAGLALPIMLVDDIKPLLASMERHLRDVGFHNISTFCDPNEALAAYARMTDKPRIVITDYDMGEGKMKGHRLISELAEYSRGQEPRFILFSGDAKLAEPGTPTSKVIEAHKVLYIQKGVDAELLELTVRRAAKRIAKGIEPTTDTITITQELEQSKFVDNPFFLFMGRVIHKMNNELFLLKMISIEDPDAESLEISQAGIQSAHRFITQLKTFVETDLSTPGLALEDSGLPQDLVKDKTVRDIWQVLHANRKSKLAVIVDAYLKNGGDRFDQDLHAVGGILLFTKTMPLELVMKKADEKFTPAAENIDKLNRAVMLLGKADETLAGRFHNYYKLLETL
jgi:CheY-like chemotaxis protein